MASETSSISVWPEPASTNALFALSQSSLKLFECAETQIWRTGEFGLTTNFPGGDSNSIAKAPELKSASKSNSSAAVKRRRLRASKASSARSLNSCSSIPSTIAFFAAKILWGRLAAGAPICNRRKSGGVQLRRRLQAGPTKAQVTVLLPRILPATFAGLRSSVTLGPFVRPSLDMEPACIRHTDLPGTSKLFADFTYHFDRVAGFYRHNPHDPESLAAAAAEIDYPDERRAAMVRALQVQNSHGQDGPSESLRRL